MWFIVYAVAACATWMLAFAGFVWNVRRVPRMEDEPSAAGEPQGPWPRLSVIVPACNEGEHIEAAVGSLLAQDYPNLEVVAVDDRSTDDTGEILERVARTEPKLSVLHVDSLSAGWLGKVNAMQQGVQAATGDWLLFTDADVHYEPAALRHAIDYAQRFGADHLALTPRFVLDGLWLAVAIRTFGLLLFLMARAGSVNSPDSKTPFGIGAFNLVRADVFARTPGFAWLRLEPSDDFGLGMMIRAVGGHTRLAFAEQDLSIRWYPSVRAMFAGLEKNTFGPGAQYSVWRLAVSVLALVLLTLGPPAAAIAGFVTGSPILLGAALAAFAAHAVASFALVRDERSEILSLLLFPAGMLMFVAMMLRSSIKCLRNGGIDWRGTHYSIAELRAGQRVKF
jgi:glycosyltransferase involved in cell wall biosynthesis